MDLLLILTKVSPYRGTTSKLKKKLYKAGLLEEKCYECGVGPTWAGKPLVLQIDHINGDSLDNTLENLRILCPNCHSQTHTYAGRNNKKGKKEYFCTGCGKKKTNPTKQLCLSCGHRKVPLPSKEDILEKVTSSMSMVSIGKHYGVSDNAVRKWVKWYGIVLK